MAPLLLKSPPPGRRRRVEEETVRRLQLIEATIETIARLGFAQTTIAEIAKRAGVSTGLVAFHFQDKDSLLEATLRHLARDLSRAAAARLRTARTPRERVQAVIEAMLGADQFDRRTATVWLAFWGQVPHSSAFSRVQRAYQRRIAANLAHALRPLAGSRAPGLAEALAALIDGLWLRATLGASEPDSASARATATAFIDAQLAPLVSPEIFA